MLSKAQARNFFLIGTAICSAVFIGLTIDTFQRIPAQTREQDITPEVIRGKHLFEKNNCMGCHTILGEGAYYAPELTKVFERRGEGYIHSVLKDPEAMFPGQRKMTNYHFSDEQISDLTAFLKWIGQMDLNGFPAKPDLMPPSSASGSSSGPQPVVFAQMCTACHSLNGQGGNVGPALDGVGSRLTVEIIRARLVDPLGVQADSKMPKLPLSQIEIDQLTQYLSQIKEGKSL